MQEITDDFRRNNMGIWPWPAHLGMTVLARLGGGHLHDLAWPPLQQDIAVLAQGGALHGEGGGRPCIARLEVQISVGHIDAGKRHREESTREC